MTKIELNVLFISIFILIYFNKYRCVAQTVNVYTEDQTKKQTTRSLRRNLALKSEKSSKAKRSKKQEYRLDNYDYADDNYYKLPVNAMYLGCFKDSVPDRALNHTIGKKISLGSCVKECSDKGYLYAGRQYYGECYCGNDGYDKHGVKEKGCYKCDSDNVGSNRNCIYLLTDNQGPTVSPTKIPEYQSKFLGCFKDEKHDRALGFLLGKQLSLDECIRGCIFEGFFFAARQYYGECYCGKFQEKYYKHGINDNCKKCDSKNVGPYRNCVYQVGMEDGSFSVSPSVSPAPSYNNHRYKYLGCFGDNSSERALPNYVGKGFIAEDCNRECSDLGYQFSGLQHKQECYCGNGNYARYGLRNGCKCEENNIGTNKNCVYEDTFEKTTPLLKDMVCEGGLFTETNDIAYFNYDDQLNWPHVKGETDDILRYKKIPNKVFNFNFNNQCHLGSQSPIDVCDGNSGHKLSNLNDECLESHRILTLGQEQAGDWKLTDLTKIQPKILGSKLRLEYATRTWGPFETCCGNEKNSYTGWCPLYETLEDFSCGTDLPPLADFAHHWNGFAQINHVDFKFPSEHTLCGKRYDAELVYWFVWPNRKATINMSILVEIGSFNFELEKILLLFEDKYKKDKENCLTKRNLRRSNKHAVKNQDILGDELKKLKRNSHSARKLYNHTAGEDNEGGRRLYHGMDIFDPFSPQIIRTLWFYAYWGSTTEPPCFGPGGNPHRFV
jgi:hypothetical protein